MILAMVGNLAARLEREPDDVEGWARLGRSYMVLSQPDKAREAYSHALKLKPDDAALFDLISAWAPDEKTRNRILVDNPAALYGFPT